MSAMNFGLRTEAADHALDDRDAQQRADVPDDVARARRPSRRADGSQRIGRVLIERVTSERFGATASLAFEPQGVTWTFEAAPAVVLAKADGGKRVLA